MSHAERNAETQSGNVELGRQRNYNYTSDNSLAYFICRTYALTNFV